MTLTFIQGHNICMQRILRHTGNNYASFVTLTWDFEKTLAVSLIVDPNAYFLHVSRCLDILKGKKP